MRLVEFFKVLEENDGVREFQDYIRQKYGIVFDLRKEKDNIVNLEAMQAPRTAPAGTGTGAMQELVAWADKNGFMLTLSLGEKGYSPEEGWKKTSSKGRLEKFYRRFGFRPNRGRYKRYQLSIYTSMYRDPQIRETSEFTGTSDPQALHSGWIHADTGQAIWGRDKAHYEYLQQYWKEMGIPEQLAKVAKDAYTGPVQLAAYENGWIRWLYYASKEDEVGMSAPEGTMKKAAPILAKLIKAYRPEIVNLEIIDPNKQTPVKSGTFRTSDRMKINQWFRNPFPHKLYEDKGDKDEPQDVS